MRSWDVGFRMGCRWGVGIWDLGLEVGMGEILLGRGGGYVDGVEIKGEGELCACVWLVFMGWCGL